MSSPISIYNDNQSSINWVHSMTTKGLRHLQIRKNEVREAVQTNFARFRHVSGKVSFPIYSPRKINTRHTILPSEA